LPDFLAAGFLEEALLFELLFEDVAGLLTLLGDAGAICVFADLEEVFLTPGRTGELFLLPFPVFFIYLKPSINSFFPI
jgi:hypothetical protein